MQFLKEWCSSAEEAERYLFDEDIIDPTKLKKLLYRIAAEQRSYATETDDVGEKEDLISWARKAERAARTL